VLTYPFVGAPVWDDLGLADDDPRRRTLRLVNPLSEAEPELRTTLLPGLLAALRRNVGRGQRDVALFEAGLVFLPAETLPPLPVIGVSRRPTDDELAELAVGIPDQPTHVGAVLAGILEPAGWWGPGRAACWADAIEAAREVARVARVPLTVRAARQAPWHPGRCAALLAGEAVVGYAGELHPRVVAALELPERTCAMELDLDALGIGGIVRAPALSSYPAGAARRGAGRAARCRPRRWPRRCGSGPGRCWSRCGCSTCTPTPSGWGRRAVAGVRAAVPRAGPDAHRRGGGGGGMPPWPKPGRRTGAVLRS
jgi:phenylalanyl-tRNA synthetase beta chain